MTARRQFFICVFGLLLVTALSALALPQPCRAATQRLTVMVDLANIRSGPSTKEDILWRVEKYYPINVIAKKGNWLQFEDFEGDRGWIHDSLVKKVRAVVTEAEDCNVRSGPGTDHEIVFKVESGVPFKVLERKGKWLHVEHADGDKGWIHGSLVW